MRNYWKLICIDKTILCITELENSIIRIYKFYQFTEFKTDDHLLRSIMHEYIDCDFKGTHDCNKNLTFSFEVLMRVYMQSVATEQIIWIFIERLTSSMGGGFLSSMYINQRYATSTNTKHTTPCQRANHDFVIFFYIFFCIYIRSVKFDWSVHVFASSC